jgi:hypothetical protein
VDEGEWRPANHYTPLKIYLVPVEQNGPNRGPEYFVWRNDANPPSVNCRWSFMDYGFVNYALLIAHDITPADAATVSAKPDVYTFPDNLDQPINDKAVIDAYFEAINLPTDWTTPATTYRELLRKVAGMMQFNQRYGGISGQSIFGGGVTLETNYNQLSAQQRAWFEQTLVDFGWFQGVQGNPKMRTLAKQAGDLWGVKTFIMGGFKF